MYMKTNFLVQNKVQMGGGVFSLVNTYSFSCAIKWIE